MSQAPQTLTCPAGHTFPYTQLTIRDGLSVCPICDQMHWAVPHRTWSRQLLTSPLVVLAVAVVMFLVEAISGIGIGAAYENTHVPGAGWLVAGSAVVIAGIVVVVIGVLRLAAAVRSSGWSRALLAAPLLVIAVGAAVVAIGDLVEIGLNISFVNGSNPGAGWQITAQVFDTLFFTGVAVAIGWAALLTRRRDRTEEPEQASTPGPQSIPTTEVMSPPLVAPTTLSEVSGQPDGLAG